MIPFDQLSRKLSARLASELPGVPSQKKMSAIAENKLRFSQSARKNARESGVLILFYPREGVWWLPMILRHDYGGIHSGQVSLPGGRREKGDRDIIHTALRETEEEIGVDRKEIKYLGQLSDLFIPVSNHIVYPSVGIIDHHPEFVREEREVQRIVNTPVAHLLDPSKNKLKTITVRGYRIKAPYFDLDNEIVWGATAMILSELKTILNEMECFH